MTKVSSKEMRKQAYFSSSPEEREQFLSINFNSSVSDVPAEWRKPFLVARGQTCERVRMEGHNLNSSVFPTDNLTIFLFSNKSHKSLENQSLSALPYIFKDESNEGVIAWHVKDSDSFFTCADVCEGLNTIEYGQNLYKLEKYKFEQKMLELQELQKSQREIKLKHTLFLQNLDELQMSEFIVILQKDLSLQENIDHVQFLKEAQDNIKDMFMQEVEMMMREHILSINQKKEDLEQYKNMQDAYYMIMGTPEVRSVVEKLPKDYSIDSMTIAKNFITDSSLPTYEMVLFIKHVGSAEK